MNGYDIIGDIHGHAEALKELLRQMGYRNTGGAWRHSSRTAVFVGDFVDRGPAQVETVMIVRSMIDSGSAKAVMGNHEFNAIAWYLADPAIDGQHLRKHTEKNQRQHQKFLDEVEGTELHEELVEWFLSLPLWLEFDGFNVVHACWHQGYIDYLRGRIGSEALLNKDLVIEASRWTEEMANTRGTRLEMFDAVETLLKGVEVPLPVGICFRDKDGNDQHNVRTRWWDASAKTYGEAALLEKESSSGPGFEASLPSHALFWSDQSRPTFVGHYWLSGAPEIQNSKVAIVDFSIAKNGYLAAYRWDGEQYLSSDKMISVAGH